jgi:hypothetical protein
MTQLNQFQQFNEQPIDLLVGGTPCQSFSVAGLRKGLADPRGNLMLTFLSIADKRRPKWIVWENVPGVLSSNGGRDFGTFLEIGDLPQRFYLSPKACKGILSRAERRGKKLPLMLKEALERQASQEM